MLPKVDKNLFKDKVAKASKKVFNFKMFIAGALLAGTAATANVSMPSSETLDNLLQSQQKNTALVLKPSENAEVTYAYHYSHSSHSSHSSHYSHYSSRY